MKTTVRISIVFGLVCLLLSSCKQDVGKSNWDVDILAPVIHTDLTMADLLADSLLVSTSDGALRLKVERSLIDLPLDSILKIPDTTIIKPIFLNGFSFNNVPPGTEIFPLTDETPYELGDVALKRVILRGGTLQLKVKSLLETAVDFTYKIPLARRFGTPFEENRSIEAGSDSNPTEAIFEFDLSGYDIDLRGTDGAGFNTLATTYILKTSDLGDTVSIAANDTFFFVEYSFLDIVPDYGAGYFGQQSTSVENENSELDVLNRITEGQMFIDSVTIGLEIKNAVGADARFRLDQLSSINTRNNNTVDLQHQIVGSNILLTRAQDPTGNSEDVIPYVVNYELNNGNSNIVEFIENLPDQLGFTFGFDINPLGNVSGGNDFFYYERPFEALMDIDVPLRASLNNLTLVDTVDWNLGQTGFIESVNSGTFTLKAVNELPLEGQVEIIMLDENMNELGTLVAPSTIASAPLNSENRVESPLESVVLIPIPESLANVLPQTKMVRIMVRFNTPGQPNLIEFYDNYGIDLKLIGNFNINFGTSVL